MRVTTIVSFLLVILFGISCRRPQPVAVRKPVPRPVTKPVAVKPVPPKAPAPKPTPTNPAMITPAPVDTVTYAFEEADATAPPKREFRAVWIATIDNIDWPSRKGLPVADQQREIVTMFNAHQKMGLNAVIVQIRSAADAFYARGSEPWSEWLTGQQGLAPEPFYDPMEFMIEEAHQRGLEFHAWFNLDRVTYSKNSSVAPGNIMYRHPEWLLTYGNRKLFNLGLPAVRSYIAGIVANVVREYDVDGIHFDDYFYPYAEPRQVLRDDSTYLANYNGMKKEDWRRDNVTRLIRELRDSIRTNKPWVKFGISPFGIWKNKRNDPDGSETNGGQSYYDNYADTRQWIREGLMDYIVPQVYFSTEFGRAPYKSLVNWWTRNLRPNCHLYVGQAVYRVGRGSERDPGWGKLTEFPNQIRHNRLAPGVQGSVLFSAKNIMLNPMAFRDSLQQNFYRYTALAPAMPWLDSIPPLPPRDLRVADTPDGVELHWLQPAPALDGDEANGYLVYRFEGHRPRIRLNDPRCIVGRCNGETSTQFVDRTADSHKKYVYVVTSIDRLNNESREVMVRIRH
jgi:uncharacterized lipoprotein YddW (UPF0748 family)